MLNIVNIWLTTKIDFVTLYTIHIFSLLPLDVQEKILLSSEFQNIKLTKGPWTVEQLAHIIDALHYFNVHLNSDITKEAAFYINTMENDALLRLNKKIINTCANFKVSLKELNDIRNTYLDAEHQVNIFSLGVLLITVGLAVGIGIGFWALVR